jgi:hypothetical protein
MSDQAGPMVRCALLCLLYDGDGGKVIEVRSPDASAHDLYSGRNRVLLAFY